MSHEPNNNCPGWTADDPTCKDPDGEHKTGPPNIIIPTKTSAWSDADREKPKPAVQVPELPGWVGSFSPGTTFTHEGWECVVRHVGCEEGHWLCLVEPVAFTPSRAIQRSAYRRLTATVGKKKAREILKEAKRKANACPDNS